MNGFQKNQNHLENEIKELGETYCTNIKTIMIRNNHK
jgi:hypothetical protein